MAFFQANPVNLFVSNLFSHARKNCLLSSLIVSTKFSQTLISSISIDLLLAYTTIRKAQGRSERERMGRTTQGGNHEGPRGRQKWGHQASHDFWGRQNCSPPRAPISTHATPLIKRGSIGRPIMLCCNSWYNQKLCLRCRAMRRPRWMPNDVRSSSKRTWVGSPCTEDNNSFTVRVQSQLNMSECRSGYVYHIITLRLHVGLRRRW